MSTNPIVLARGHTEAVTTLSLSDHLLASGSADGNTYFWSLDQSPCPVLQAPRYGHCSSIKFSVKQENILYGAYSQEIISWDIRNLRQLFDIWKVNEGRVNSIDVSETEDRLASADDTGTVQIIDLSNGSLVRTLKKHDNSVSSVKFRPGRPWQLVSGGVDCKVVVSDWRGSGLAVNIFELSEIADYSGSDSNNVEADYSYIDSIDDESLNVLLRSNSTMNFDGGNTRTNDRIRDRFAEQIARLFLIPTPVSFSRDRQRRNISVRRPCINSVSCSMSGDIVAASLDSKTIELFSGYGKKLMHYESLYGHDGRASTVHFINETLLVSGSCDENIFVWNIESEAYGQATYHGEEVSAFEGRRLDRLIVADSSPVIKVLDLSVE
uniref:Anaphase-promoting complex subunit 4-like WD40 domain-containing protein n=1 Tax=Trichobilharzia regenti TaxID=157069 RepID=A0AA85J1J9_TRIRE|nr:unnamed protein product [Trichobilharzia regenti]